MSSRIQETKEFGPHLILDCRKINREKSGSIEVVSQFLSKLPELLGMTKIIPPYVFYYQGLVPEDEGITGMVMIAESHISFHSFTQKDYFFFDCFSCKPFDIDLVKNYVIETFDVKEIEEQCFARGKHFPR